MNSFLCLNTFSVYLIALITLITEISTDRCNDGDNESFIFEYIAQSPFIALNGGGD